MVIRADANEDMGTGHVLRSLALAQAWRRRSGEVTFVGVWSAPGLRARLQREGAEIVPLAASHPQPTDLKITLNLLSHDPRACLVLDGYHFDRRYHEVIKDSGHTLLVVDDLAHLDHYAADIIVNHSPAAGDLRYPTEAYTRCLLGPRYALVREEFLRRRRQQNASRAGLPRILVSFGGSDPYDQTAKVIRALTGLSRMLEPVAVAGPANPRAQALQRQVEERGVPVTVLSNVADMGAVVLSVDMGVCGAGSTSLELAFMGVPMLLLVLAENQKRLAVAMEGAGAAISLGWWEEVTEPDLAAAVAALLRDKDRRQQMSAAGRRLVDGRGADRVINELQGMLQ